MQDPSPVKENAASTFRIHVKVLASYEDLREFARCFSGLPSPSTALRSVVSLVSTLSQGFSLLHTLFHLELESVVVACRIYRRCLECKVSANYCEMCRVYHMLSWGWKGPI